ncbi:WD40 repeat domain-containing serine/threonine protein kinase [Streptomyces albipurpureus]|uniref:Serine/threonine protein kinase n=1 Tax=Streptomyces albipurpureus TaxID=2897419 RepID=A0ABT0UI34_9ACTN|nr:serine/threonine-protein kinase [Streptomyces sp. CWNU-1]MCM2387816.1 serine/threonine protein kinase [Streptomyces sp. CWNU-1]
MAGVAGLLVGGRYRLDEPVGQGGMGRVWRGHDEVLDRVVAVKEVLLPPGLPTELRDQLVARTRREARSAARLHHPGIVTVYDWAEHDGAPWIVMEFVRGDSLARLIARDGPLGWQKAASMGADLADALAHAHAAGVVHRDLKPDNVMLVGDRTVITDFGIARILDATSQLTSTHTVIGTPQYMPPEQLEGKRVEAPADLWALGITLYTAVEGHPPFNGPTLTSIITAVLTQPLPPAPKAGPLGELLIALTAKAYHDRPDAPTTGQRLRAARDTASILHSAPTQAAPLRTRSDPPPTPTAPDTINPTTQRGPSRRSIVIGGVTALAATSGALIALRLDDGRSSRFGDLRSTSLGHDSMVLSVAFSPDGKTLASTSDTTVRLWDVASRTNTATLKGHTGFVYSLAFSPDGKTLASGIGDGGIWLWDVPSRTVSATLNGHTHNVTSVAFSPDGTTLASGSEDMTIRLWDTADRASTSTLKGPGLVHSVAFSPDGTTLASGSEDMTVQLWDVASRTNTATLKGHTGFVYSVAFSPNNKILASGGGDSTVRLWDVAQRTSTATLEDHTESVTSVAFRPDGKTLASGSADTTVRLWDVAKQSSVATLKDHTDDVTSIAFSANGKYLASGSIDLTARLWKLS